MTQFTCNFFVFHILLTSFAAALSTISQNQITMYFHNLHCQYADVIQSQFALYQTQQKVKYLRSQKLNQHQRSGAHTQGFRGHHSLSSHFSKATEVAA
jgi:hypothetical protein